MVIYDGEFSSLARSMKGKNKSAPPTVKAPKATKLQKSMLIPWGNSPQTRSALMV